MFSHEVGVLGREHPFSLSFRSSRRSSVAGSGVNLYSIFIEFKDIEHQEVSKEPVKCDGYLASLQQ